MGSASMAEWSEHIPKSDRPNVMAALAALQHAVALMQLSPDAIQLASQFQSNVPPEDQKDVRHILAIARQCQRRSSTAIKRLREACGTLCSEVRPQ